jgi:hypothetical protein
MRSVGVVVSCFLLWVAGVATPVSADSSTCVESAVTASLLRPHAIDPAGDESVAEGVPAVVHGGALDITAAWLSRPSASDRVTANLAVRDLSLSPFGGMYTVEFGNGRWVGTRAVALYPWTFEFGDTIGTPAGAVRQVKGGVTGDVNLETGVISLEIPPAYLPRRPADGSAVVLPAPQFHSAYSSRPPVLFPVIGLGYDRNVTVDSSDNAVGCSVLLYEQAPDS